MSSVRVGINGFGRNCLRRALRQGHTVAAVNDITDTATLAHLRLHLRPSEPDRGRNPRPRPGGPLR